MKENYISYLRHTKGYSDATVHGYNYILTRFNDRLSGIGKSVDDPEAIKLVDIYNFLENISKEGLSARTCAWMIDGIRGYLRYCKDIVELDIIDLHKIKSPKVPDKEIGFFSADQKARIIRLFEKGVGARDITQLRNRLLTYMLLHTGLRCHEIAKIKVCDIGESLQIIGKGGVRRFVFLRKEILDLVYLYLGKRNKKSDYLFDGNKGGHLTTDRIRRIYNTLSKDMGFRVHPHKFRHTFATDLLHVPGANIYAVSKLMGHKKITTTQIYLGTDNVELKKIQFGLKF